MKGIDGAHIADIPVSEPEGAPLPEGAEAPVDTSQFVPFAVFYENFKGLFFIAAATSVAWSPVGAIPEIEIQPHEEQAARGTAEIAYGICCKTPFLRWAVSPGSKTARDLTVVATFAAMKYQTIQAAVAAKVATQQQERKAA